MTKDEVLIRLSESELTAFGKVDFAVQSFPQKVFSAVWAVESELNNGGFSQYFPNSSAETAFFVAEALDTIGAPQTAAICRRAVEAAYPQVCQKNRTKSHPRQPSSRMKSFANLDAIDREFFAYPHDLTDLLFAYVSQHPDEFGPVPNPS